MGLRAVGSRTICALIALVVISVSPVFAQAPSLLFLRDAYPWDPSNTAAQIDYAFPSTTAIPAAIAARVDGGAWVSMSPICDRTSVGEVRWCHLMTPALKTALDVPGLHRVEIANGLDASPAFLLKTPTPAPTTCPYTTLAGVSDPKPVGYRMGARRAVSLTNPDPDVDAFAKRVGQLEDWGWRVQWVAVSDSLGRLSQLAMTARCVG